MQQENKKSLMRPIKQPKVESKYLIIDAYQILKKHLCNNLNISI